MQTVPRDFVQAHNLHRCQCLRLYCDGEDFEMKVIVYPERRYTQFGRHASANVVLKGKWMDLKKKCAFEKDKIITFELTYACYHPNYVAVFKIY